MKKIVSLALAAIMLAVTLILSSCSGGGLADLKAELEGKLEGNYENDLAGTTLYVYNWGEYISDGEDDTLDINAAFEAVTGIHVEYSTYDSNESMYATVSGGGVEYDVVIPSDYMIERLIKEDRLEKIDVSKLQNYKYIGDEYKDLFYDPDNE